MTNKMIVLLMMLLLGTGSAISGVEAHRPADAVVVPVQLWGSMREVLAQGQTEARIALSDIVNSNTVGIGALAGLEGEVTILDGVIHISTVTPENNLAMTAVVGGESQDQATLLAVSDVSHWDEVVLPDVSGISDLEMIIAKELAARNFDLNQPVPFKVNAVFGEVSIHVLNHSCPIANPTGPEPWRGQFKSKKGFLVGVYAEGSGGKLTHHGSNSHIHAVVMEDQDVHSSGHVESVGLVANSVLYLPSR